MITIAIGHRHLCPGIKKNFLLNLSKKINSILIFLRDRFRLISSCISFDHFDTRNERKINDNKFFKMRIFYDNFRKNIRAALTPGLHLTIDETLFSFQGRCAHRQYIKSKPAKYGLKYNNIVDTSTAYLLDTLPYLGKSTDKNETNLGQKLVEALSEFYYETNRLLFKN